MRSYEYVARSEAGARSEGTVVANTRDEAISRLRDEGLIVERVREAGSGRDLGARLRGRRLRDRDLALVSGQLATLVASGLSVERAVGLAAEQVRDEALAQALSSVAADVAAGYTLSGSLARQELDLPPAFVESVRAGEESGELVTTFERLADYYDRQGRLRGRARAALVYPSLVIVVSLVVMTAIMVYAVPVFSSAFASFGSNLPVATHVLIALSDFLVAWWWVIALVLALAALAFRLALSGERFRVWWARRSLGLPVVGRIGLMSATEQYASTLALALSARLPVTRSVSVAAHAMSNHYLAGVVEGMVADLESGRPLSACLREAKALPEMVTEMTVVGEQSDTLAESMEVVRDYFDGEVDAASSQALTLFEPTAIIVLAVLVLMLLLAVYVPMFDMYSLIR